MAYADSKDVPEGKKVEWEEKKLKSTKLTNIASETDWEREWKNMPEYIQEKQKPFYTLTVRFRNQEDYETFSKLIEQNLTKKTRSVWFPKLVPGIARGKTYIDK